MKRLIDFSSRFRILKGGKISLVVSALLGTTTLTFAAPSGGVVTSGSANISQVGNTTNITQNTGKVSINWNKFNIASNETVNFKQPNVNSIALNRVIGNEKSIINGALNANGQVWILNSNGVLFGKNAKINTAGLLATTKNLSDEDFNASNYTFKGNSTQSVINLGEIDISESGYATLLANTVSNEGTIKAVKGQVHLVGANEVTINLNGNSIVDLTVDKGVLDALVENKGAVYADGGEIYLTTNAVDELLKGVVNNEGVVEANSFEGVTGYVELFAHGGEAKIGGTITAKDGFVETSGKDFTFNDATIKAGKWLIDPVDITINQSLADAIETQLSSGDVMIETDASNTPDTTSGENSSGNGDIFITGDIEYTGGSDRVLTLKAYRNIVFGNQYKNANAFGSISSTTAALNTILWSGTSGNGGSVWLPSGSGISTNGGDITMGGGNDSSIDYAVGTNILADEHNAPLRGITINSAIDAGGGDILLKGKANQVAIHSRGVSLSGSISTSGDGDISIYAIAKGDSDAFGSGDSSISLENGTLYISGEATSSGSSNSIEIYNNFSISSTGTGMIILDGNNDNVISDATSYIDADKLLILNAAKVDLQSNLNDVNTLATSNISDAFDFYDTGDLSIDSATYNGTIYSGLSINADTTIETTGAVSLNSDIFWSTASKLTLTSSTNINVNSILKNTNSSDGGVYFDATGNVVFNSTTGKVIINNANQLQWMNTALNGNYELGSNIDASDTSTWNSGAGWNPIGTFTGTFDGQNHSISDLFINRPNASNQGLFGQTDNVDKIANINLINVNITGKDRVGALVGDAIKTHVENVSSSGKVVGETEVGGLVGYIINASNTILKSSSSADVSGVDNVGGLVGDLNFKSAIRNSYATGKVTGTGSNIGGLAGNTNYGTIENSYAAGEVAGTTTMIGGLVGSKNGGTIINSFYDKDTTKQTQGVGSDATATGATGKTTAQIKEKETFKDWDIQEDNTLDPSTPFLAWEKDGNSYTKVWVIGTKVASKGGGTTTPTNPTTPKEIDKVVTTIVNKEAVKVPNIPKVTTTPNNAGKNVNVAFSIGENKQIVSKPIEGQTTKRVTLSEAKQMQQETTGQTVGDVKVPLSRSSQIVLVNGGVSLPNGVEQEFYVAEDEI